MQAGSVAFDELGQAVLGEEVVDRLAEQRLEGGVAVGGEPAASRRSWRRTSGMK